MGSPFSDEHRLQLNDSIWVLLHSKHPYSPSSLPGGLQRGSHKGAPASSDDHDNRMPVPQPGRSVQQRCMHRTLVAGVLGVVPFKGLVCL